MRFDRAGVCYIFCNIHPEMSAVVIVLDTPYYGISNRRGLVDINRVPSGENTVHVWNERSLPEDLAELRREVAISPANASLGATVPDRPGLCSPAVNAGSNDRIRPACSA